MGVTDLHFYICSQFLVELGQLTATKESRLLLGVETRD